jgi:DNA-binding IclR family transcriptional regulator
MTIQATERSFRIIETICDQDGARLDDLEEELGIARSTIYRHLQTLTDCGYIVKKGEVYNLGVKFLHFGEYTRTRECGYRLAQETLRELEKETNEECEFIAESGGRGILVHESYHPDSQFQDSSGQSNGGAAQVGSYYRLHNHAAGKAILAEFSDQRVEKIIDRWGLPPKTRNTITTEEELWAELDRIRERGVAFTDEEFTEGLREVAVSVTNPDGSCLGAIAVFGPTYRIDDEMFTEYLPRQLKRCVSELEASIKDEYLSNFT